MASRPTSAPTKQRPSTAGPSRPSTAGARGVATEEQLERVRLCSSNTKFSSNERSSLPARTLDPAPAPTVKRALRCPPAAPDGPRVRSREALLAVLRLVEVMRTREVETDAAMVEAMRKQRYDADLADDLRREVADLRRQVAEYDKLDAVFAPSSREARQEKGRERNREGGREGDKWCTPGPRLERLATGERGPPRDDPSYPYIYDGYAHQPRDAPPSRLLISILAVWVQHPCLGFC